MCIRDSYYTEQIRQIPTTVALCRTYLISLFNIVYPFHYFCKCFFLFLQKIRNLHEYAYANMTIMGNFYNLHSKYCLIFHFYHGLGGERTCRRIKLHIFSAMQKYETKQTVNKMLNLRRIRLHINFKRFQQK